MKNFNILESPILQGGMGVGVSGWPLARAVSITDQLGIVSGTGLDLVFSRLVQDGDTNGVIRRALEHFPLPEMGERVWKRYFGKKPDIGYKLSPMISHSPSKQAIELIIVATFVEIWLAKEGHKGLIGINFLEKLQTPHLYATFGAILADVNVVIVGAGLPTQFPEMLERLSSFEIASYDLDVGGGSATMELDPSMIMSKGQFLDLKTEKPLCLGIVSTFLAANILFKRSSYPFDGFVVELPVAGGHNAPPRNKETKLYDMEGKDNPGIKKIQGLGLPFWVAGGHCSPEAIHYVLENGARGVQVGTAFSLCRESGFPQRWKQQRIEKCLDGKDVVTTNHLASPTGFPFKEVQWEGTASEENIYNERTRICDIGRLRKPYKIDGKTVWRCSSEPVKDYVAKGGKIEDTVGRKCICNGLMAAINLGQTQKDGSVEPALFTSGDDVAFLKHLELGKDGLYSASQVINYLLGTQKSA